MREIGFYNSFYCNKDGKRLKKTCECYRYLYPIYKPRLCFKLVKLGDNSAPSPTLSSLAGLLWNRCCCCFSEGHCVATLLWLRLWLPPVYTRRHLRLPLPSCSRAHSALPSSPTGPVLPGTTSGPPTPPRCPVLPGSTVDPPRLPWPCAALVLRSSSNY